MDDLGKFKNITAIKPTNINEFGEDPNSLSHESLAYEKLEELKAAYKRKEELLDYNHKNSLWFVKVINWLTKFVIVFLPLLMFVILPLSEISLDNRGILEWGQAWAKAFISTNTSIGLAIGALTASALLHKLFEYVQRNKNSDKYKL